VWCEGGWGGRGGGGGGGREGRREGRKEVGEWLYRRKSAADGRADLADEGGLEHLGREGEREGGRKG